VFLVDTNVVSAGARSKNGASPALIAWMDERSADLYMSAVSIAEIESGIAKLHRQGAKRKAGDLTAWLDTLLHLYEDRVLPFDVPTARIAGALSDLARSKGHAPGFVDVAIAATAERLGATILTTNIRHFEPLGVPFLDPSAGLPPPPAVS
jgi:predicted nucleic acid-binding protein